MTTTQIGKVYRVKKEVAASLKDQVFALMKLENNGIWERHNEILVDLKKIKIEITGRGEIKEFGKLVQNHIAIVYYNEQPDSRFKPITKDQRLTVCITVENTAVEEDIETLDSTGHEGEIWNAIEGRWKWF